MTPHLCLRIESDVLLLVGQALDQRLCRSLVSAAEIEDPGVAGQGSVSHDHIGVVRADVSLGAAVQRALQALRGDRIVGVHAIRTGGERRRQIEERARDHRRSVVGGRHHLTLAAALIGNR